MKINTTYNEFLNEKKNKKNSIKSKVKKIDKKIKKTVDKQEDLVKTAKELADSPEPSDKMKSSLAKVQLRQSSAKAQELVMRKEAEILKNKIKTAKRKERATNENMKHIKLFEQFISEKKSKSDYEDIIDKYESKIWELDNANASWIPTDSSKKEKMRQTFQKKIDAAQKALDKLDEALVSEKSGDSYSSGCVMLYFDFPMMNKIHDGIDPNDLYEEEGDRTFGLEDEPHCTLLYGLEDSVTVEQVKEILEQHTFGTCKVHNASLFENDYDVLKLDVKGDSLHACNKALCELPYNNQYPDYHPHMTIAYLQKGTGKKYCDRMDGHEYELTPTHAVFSQPDGTKTKIKINID